MAFASISVSALAQTSAETLYLKEEISVVSPTGITSLPPGTAVTSLGAGKDGIKIKSADGNTAVVKQTQVTADKAVAQQLIQAEADRQAKAKLAMAQAMEQQRQASARNAELINQSAAQSAVQASAVTSSVPPAANATAGLQRTAIKYEAEEANVTVKPPTLKKKKKK